MPVIERRSRVVCHLPMNRLPTQAKTESVASDSGVYSIPDENESDRLYDVIPVRERRHRILGVHSLRTNSSRLNVVLVVIDHPLDKSDLDLWQFVSELKREIQRLYKRYADQKEKDVRIVVHSIDAWSDGPLDPFTVCSASSCVCVATVSPPFCGSASPYWQGILSSSFFVSICFSLTIRFPSLDRRRGKE